MGWRTNDSALLESSSEKEKGRDDTVDEEAPRPPTLQRGRQLSQVGAVAVPGMGAATEAEISADTLDSTSSDSAVPLTSLDREVSVEATLVTEDDYQAELQRVILKTAVKASIVEPHEEESTSSKYGVYFWVSSCAVGWFVLAVLAMAVFLGLHDFSDKDSDINHDTPSPEKPPLNETTLIAFLKHRSFDGGESLRIYTSAQRTALRFIAAEFPEADLDEKLIDLYVVTTLFFSTGGIMWTNNTRWKSGESVCLWQGIVCDENGYVVSIEKSKNNLGGFVPAEIGLLAPRTVGDNGTLTTRGLRILDLSENNIGASLPTEIGLLTEMQVFSVHGNAFTGQIPLEIARWTALQRASFAVNQLTGSIPLDLCATNAEITVDCAQVQCECCLPNCTATNGAVSSDSQDDNDA